MGVGGEALKLLFQRELERLSEAQGLSEEEEARILSAFEEALEDPSLSERQILQRIVEAGGDAEAS